MIIWPFAIRENLIEALEWATDVIRTKNREQRFAQRQAPRTTLNFDHYLTVQEYRAAQALIRQNDSFLVPEWQHSVKVGVLLAGSDTPVFYGEPYSGMTDGDSVLIWESPTKYESAVIESADSVDTFYVDIVNDYENARVVPLKTAEAPRGLRPQRKAGNFVTASIVFELTESADIGQSSYPQYRSHDVITECPVIAGGTFSEPINFPVTTFDDDINFPVYLDTRNTFDSITMMRWHFFTRAEIYTLRRFIHSRRGKHKAFWLSTWSRDFELAQAVGSTDTSIIVYAPNEVTDLGYTSFDIDIGGQYYRNVTSYSVTGVALNGRTLLQLNIDSQIGVTIASDTRISYLNFMRFNADRVEFNYAAKAGASVAIPCIELNEL